jgi:hypothetical protein
MGPYFKDRDTTHLLAITSHFPIHSKFENVLYDYPILTIYELQKDERQYDISLFHWNGILLQVGITNRIDLCYTIMRLSGYLAVPNDVIFEALDHTM